MAVRPLICICDKASINLCAFGNRLSNDAWILLHLGAVVLVGSSEESHTHAGTSCVKEDKNPCVSKAAAFTKR